MDADLKAVVENTAKAVDAKMEDLRVADAITEIFNCSNAATNILMRHMPWALAKDEAKKDRLATVLYNLIESISEQVQDFWSHIMPSTSREDP